MESAIIAVDGDTAAVRLEVSYVGLPRIEYRDLWILEFDQAGRCRSIEEWPFWPRRPRVGSGDAVARGRIRKATTGIEPV